MACDASYITAVADRLEELGLAVRRNAADDRRVRELVLTAKGESVSRAAATQCSARATRGAAWRCSTADRRRWRASLRKLGDLPDSSDWLPSPRRCADGVCDRPTALIGPKVRGAGTSARAYAPLRMFRIVRRESLTPRTFLWEVEAPDVAASAQRRASS